MAGRQIYLALASFTVWNFLSIPNCALVATCVGMPTQGTTLTVASPATQGMLSRVPYHTLYTTSP